MGTVEKLEGRSPGEAMDILFSQLKSVMQEVTSFDNTRNYSPDYLQQLSNNLSEVKKNVRLFFITTDMRLDTAQSGLKLHAMRK